MAREFNLTKATISDSVNVLLKKEYLQKDYSPTDKRRYNLKISAKGSKLVHQLSEYAAPISEELSLFKEGELIGVFDTISKLIYQLNQRDIIQVQRTCFNCKYYSGDKKDKHYCNLMQSALKKQEIRLDCNEFEKKLVGNEM